jgi:hypothetical protein
LTGTNFKYYFFEDITSYTFEYIIINDYEGYVKINNGTKDLLDKIEMKDLFSSIESGKKYKIAITINQNAIEVGNITVDNWTNGGE